MRRVLLGGLLIGLLGSAAPGCGESTPTAPPALDLEEMTISDLQAAMSSGKLSSRQITEAYLQRIEDIDRGGPALRSIIELNPDALPLADALDAERRGRGARGPLHGIPILIKDNIDTADLMTTTAGSLALEGSLAQRDAHVVERLRAAGVVLLGKTNLSEWANFRSMHSTSGWSARGGQVKNPYALDRNPCGSSSGSGVAVSANLAAAAVGTETDGSIVCPASANGLVGLKPTVGLVSRSGIIPISVTQDTAGPMARTVRDAALVLNAMAGEDSRDPATARAASAATDYAAQLDEGALKGARIGVPRRRYFGYSPDADRLTELALEVMKAQGAVIVDPADIPTAGKLDACELEILFYEFKDGLNAYLADRGPDVSIRSLADLIAFNEREREREMPFFGQDLLIRSEAKGPLTSPAYREALKACRTAAGAEGIDAVMAEHRLDALVAPTGSPAWPIDWINGDHFTGASSSPAAVAGYPNVTVPAGFIHGLPVGISFFGGAWSDATLLRLAYAYEQATRHRRVPQLLPTVAFERPRVRS
jgi:amidase